MDEEDARVREAVQGSGATPSANAPAPAIPLPLQGLDELTLDQVRKLMQLEDEEQQRRAAYLKTTKHIKTDDEFMTVQYHKLHNKYDNDNDNYNYDDDDDDDDSLSWQVLLGPAARAAWRASDQKPPVHWYDKRQDILQRSEQSSKTLKRNYQKVMESQKALQERRERERRKEKLQRYRSVRPDSLAEKHATSGHRRESSSATAIYYKRDFTFATLQHRLLPNLELVKRVLKETQALLPDFKPKRIIDFGIGVGSSSAAAIDIFGDIEWVHGIDASKSMRDCAQHVLANTGPRITTDASLATKSAHGNFDLALFVFTATDLPNIPATMAAAAVLWEKLSPNGVFVMVEPGTPDGFSNIRSVRTMLLDCCPPEKVTRDDDDDVDVYDKDDDDDYDDDNVLLDQCHIIAPCTHNGVCPMERHRRQVWPGKPTGSDTDDTSDTTVEGASVDDIDEAEYTAEDHDDRFGRIAETDAFDSSFCSFVHTIPGTSNLKGDKLSYLVAQKRHPSFERTGTTTNNNNNNNTARFPNLTELLAETYRSSNDRDPINHEIMLYEANQIKIKFEALEDEDPLGLSILVGDTNRQSFGRIVRAPLKRKGHVLVDYCAKGEDGNGRIVRHRLGKAGTAKIAPGQYAAARKARWGGLWPHIIDKIN